jgi:ribosome maturation factor RimP
MQQNSKIQELIEPSIVALGIELWGVELCPAGSHSILRVYIDSPSGVSLDLCAEVSHQISAVLDVEDAVKTKYNLEVSSPGLDRKLFKPSQYKPYIGKKINIVLKLPQDGRRRFAGVLQSADADGVKVQCDNNDVSFSFFEIDSANVCII